MSNEKKPDAEGAEQPEERVPRVRTRKMRENPAAQILMAKGRKEMEQQAAKQRQINDENLHYIRCPRHVEHHGVYLTERATASIHPGMWFSIEHQAGDPWYQHRIRCQECLADGDENVWLPLRGTQMPDGNYSFTVLPPPGTKILFAIPRSELEVRLGKTIEDMLAPAAASGKGGE